MVTIIVHISNYYYDDQHLSTIIYHIDNDSAILVTHYKATKNQSFWVNFNNHEQ